MNIEITENLKSIIERTCKFLAENGIDHEEYLRKGKNSSDENFGFLFSDSSYYLYYKNCLNSFNNNNAQKNINQNYVNENIDTKNNKQENLNNQNQNLRKKNRWSDPIDIKKKNFDTMNQNIEEKTQNNKEENFNNFYNTNNQVLQNNNKIIYKSVDEIPIGIMTEMFKYQKKIKNNSGPIDPTILPSYITSYDKPVDIPEFIKVRIDNFYKFVDEEREFERKQRRKREKEKETELIKNKEKYDYTKKRDIQREVEDLYENDEYDINPETGMRNDGQVLVNSFQNIEERQGVGGQLSESDIYAKFRKQRSYQYHVTAEERSLTRDQPELCFVCQMPGHIAKDCKFGLT